MKQDELAKLVGDRREYRIKDNTKDLFKGLKIEDEKEIMKLQGQYPVNFIAFNNQKHRNYMEK